MLWILDLLRAKERYEYINIWGHALIWFCRKQCHLTFQPLLRTDYWAFSNIVRVELYIPAQKSLGHLYTGGINIIYIFLVHIHGGVKWFCGAGEGQVCQNVEFHFTNSCLLELIFIQNNSSSPFWLNVTYRAFASGCFWFFVAVVSY